VVDRNNPWLRTARRTVYRNAWLTLWEDEVVRPDGAPGIYGVVHFVHRAVGVVPLDERGRLLMVGQWRYPLDRWSWEIPEGGARPDEEGLSAVRRELAEETGYSAGEWRELLQAHLSNSVTDELATVWLATGLVKGTAAPEGTERIETRWIPFDEVLEMCLDGRISDALTILGVQRLALDPARPGRLTRP
jgi:8-oxo-dGTP pyrophosphatase MutT (NUDIX family)